MGNLGELLPGDCIAPGECQLNQILIPFNRLIHLGDALSVITSTGWSMVHHVTCVCVVAEEETAAVLINVD